LGPGHDKVLALLAWPYGGSSVRTTDPPLSNFEKALTGADPNLGRVIAAVVARIGQQRINPSKSTPYEALARAVVYQSISAGAAAIIFGRLQQAVTKPFSPAKVLRMTEHSITATGLSKAKARAIVSLAEWFMANRKLAKALPDLPDADVVSALTNIAGIGTWTANADSVDDVVGVALDALDQLRGIKPVKENTSAPTGKSKGKKLPQREFRIPLLEALIQLGNEAPAKKVREVMEKKMPRS
jgi:hypothetical protein